MKLKYRGVSYDFTPVEVASSGEFKEGKYRGVPVKYPILTADVPCPEVELSYRGVAYKRGQSKGFVPTAQGAAPGTTTAETPSIDERIRRLMLNHQYQIRKREQAMLARADAEVGLTAGDAAHYRNHIQGYVPYNEQLDYERSHVAMS